MTCRMAKLSLRRGPGQNVARTISKKNVIFVDRERIEFMVLKPTHCIMVDIMAVIGNTPPERNIHKTCTRQEELACFV